MNNLIIYYGKLPNKCNISSFNLGKDAFEKKKKLYLLAEILYWIEEKYESISYYEQDLYNKFFAECVNTFKEIVSSDNCEIKKEYNTELNNFIKNFNSTKAYINGKKKSIFHDDLKSPDASMCLQDLKQKAEEPDRGAEQKVNEDAGHTRREGEPHAPVLEKQSLEEVPDSQVGIADHAVHMNDNRAGVPKEPSDDNISNPLGTIIGTSLGFVVPLITIYKLTPLGSWINTRILGRNNILKNMERNNQQLLLNSTENREINLGETMYRIKYNS